MNDSTYKQSFEKVRRLYQQPVLTASIEVILSVFAVAFMVAFAIKPTAVIVVGLQKKIVDQALVNQKLTTKITALSQAQKNLTDYADKIVFYSRAVPDNPDLEGVAQRIEIMAQENGIRLESLQFGAVPMLGDRVVLGLNNNSEKVIKSGEIYPITISFSITGKLENILMFIKSMERIDRIVIVREIYLQKQEVKDKTQGSVRASGKTEIFYKFGQSQK
ncbi:MAG: hypothetical protein ACD_57C00048G0003 [uncultured bacterium]|nr:MAG: hypothetical protein ACD_57C00048G0003 [uncultured bacterium]